MAEDDNWEWRHMTSTSKEKRDGKLTFVGKVLKKLRPVSLLTKGDQSTSPRPKQFRTEGSFPVQCELEVEEKEQHESRGSFMGDTVLDPGADGSREIPPVQGSSDKESPSLSQATEHQNLETPINTMDEVANKTGIPGTSTSSEDTESAKAELLTRCDDYQLFQLTNFYRERLKPAMEQGVERFSFVMREGGYFSGQEHEKVSELVEKGNRADSSKLFLSLVMEKGSGSRRVMWESFVKMRDELHKLDKILKEIQELGPDPYEYMNIAQNLCVLSSQLMDVQQKHKETLRAETETLSVNTILVKKGKVEVFQLVDRYAELTVISTVRDRRLVEHELLARGRDHEEWRENSLRRELEKIRIDQLFQSSFSRRKSKLGRSAVVAGVPGIGKTTMVQKIVYDWATGKIYQHFQFIFAFKFRDLNSINCRINLSEMILDRYPYFRNILGEVLKNPEGLLFIFDSLDEFNCRIDVADGGRDIESQHKCPDYEFRCEVSDIVSSLIQHQLLPGCSVLVTTRPTVLHSMEKAEISVWAEILGLVGEKRKEYFTRFFDDQAVAAAVFKHVEENEILSTMSYNPSYCSILCMALGPFFVQRHQDRQRVPKTITQLYSYYICNILKNHGREIDCPREVLLRLGQMAFAGVAEKKIVFTDGDLIKYNLHSSQFLSGFLVEFLEREDCARSVVYTFPHLTIQEFVAALAQFLTPDPGNILKFLTEAHSATDGRFEVFLRFVAGLSSPLAARLLEEFLGPFPHQTTCQVIDWVKEEVKRQAGNTFSDAGKRSLLNTLHYLFESQNRALAQKALGSVEMFSFRRLRLTPIDCAIVSHVIGLSDTIKHLDLWSCYIQCEGLQRLGPGLHKCRELGLDSNNLGDSGVKRISVALRNPTCQIQKLGLGYNGLSESGAEELVSALSANHSMTDLNLSGNKLGDSGVKILSAALRHPDCKIQILRLDDVGVTHSGVEDLVFVLGTNPTLTALYLCSNNLGDSRVKLACEALRNPDSKMRRLGLWDVGFTDSDVKDLVSSPVRNHSLIELNLGKNALTDCSLPALRRLILSLPSLERMELGLNLFSSDGQNQVKSLQQTRPGLTINCEKLNV